jgi:hypothetical protein
MTSKFKSGDKVILGKHKDLGNGPNWSENMNQFLGKIATLKEINKSYNDPELTHWRVDVDGGRFIWREINMTLVLMNEKQVCDVCKKSCPHLPPNEDDKFICVVCQTIRSLNA